MNKVLCWLLGHKFKTTILEYYKTPKVINHFSKNCGTISIATCKIQRECQRCKLTIVED